jgi:signal transduction histidine kinase
MLSRAWSRSSQRLIAGFVLVVLVPALAIVWLGIRLIEQDRAVAHRQLRERRAVAAERLIAALELAVSTSERRFLGDGAGSGIPPDEGAVTLTMRAGNVDVYPRGRVLYFPVLPVAPEADAVFATAESLEFREHDLRGAATAYGALTASPEASIRAGALLRQARTLRKAGRPDEALSVYSALARLTTARVAGLPAELVARRARCLVLHDLARLDELGNEARALQADLAASRWPLDRGTFLGYSAEADRWAGTRAAIASDRRALSAASEWVWQQWAESERGEFPSAGRRSLRFSEVGVTVLWQTRGNQAKVLVAGPRFQQMEWFDRARLAVEAGGLRVTLVGADGEAVLGEIPADLSNADRRSPEETQLPWTIIVRSADVAAELAGVAARRRFLLASLAMLISLVVAGSYFIVRAVSRELAVAELQSDFVAAVSHEFRTPLTSLRQFTELLNEEPDAPAVKRRLFYQAQARATDRLRRLVESLLDFGRMEAGARPYELERVSIDGLVARVVDDFRRDGAPAGFTVESHVGADTGAVNVDQEAFARALWNLLDNAVKYSGASRTVDVTVAMADGQVAIGVRDWGLGIPAAEHETIFNKFVRGAASRVQGIKGTGIGLAMVRHIVSGHGGTVAVASTVGAGSTFTITLPRERA